jgi:hypothetical protein
LNFFLAGENVCRHSMDFFWILVYNNELRFHPRDNACKKLFTLSTETREESSATRHMLQLVFIGQLSQHPPGTQRVWCHVHTNANVQQSGNSVHRNPPLLTNKCVHVSNVRITNGCAWATWVMIVNDKCSAFLKSFYPLVDFPFIHTASTILLNHSSVNLCQCHSFWPQILITERCSSLVQLSSGVATILELSFESRLSCHRLYAARTCPIDVSTRCSSFIRLRPILSNIQSICPYLFKSPRTM